MTVYRIQKAESFTQIDNRMITDNTITAKAKGILLYLLSKPNEWKVYEVDIVNNMRDGKDSVRSGLKELIEVGYIHRERMHDERGRFAGYSYIVYEYKAENPHFTVSGDTVNGKSENGESENGKTVNGEPAPSNTKLTNTELSNTKNNNTEKENIVDDKSPTPAPLKTGKRIFEEHEQPLVLAKYLHELIKRNNPYAKEPNFQEWGNHIRLMHEVDGIEYSVIQNCISWCQNDSFWYKNILSTKKLREKFQTLYMQAQDKKGGNAHAANRNSFNTAPATANQEYADGLDF